MLQRTTKLIIVFLFTFICTGYASTSGTDLDFPVFPSLEPNIEFWKKVYSVYSSNQGIIHDNDQLNIIYEIIELEPRKTRSARKRNIRLIRKTKKYYANQLRKLARNPYTEDEKARKVAALFGTSATAADFSAAVDKVRFQRGQKNFFRDGLIRSGQYLSEISAIFSKHNLPNDLIYLPHVESSFNLHAYSKFGAAGIWQFTHSTGKRFMKVNYTVDQRWDPIYASNAAARLLKKNHALLGSWPLALTAYNHGASAMKRAKKAKGSYEKIFEEYDGRRFKFASRNFYSEFLAAREIAKNVEHYFPGLMFKQPLKTKTFVLDGYISVKSLSKHVKLKPSTIRSLNRSLREPVFRDQKYIPNGFHLRLPAKKGMEKLVASIPADLYKAKQKRSHFYWVRKGDVASVVARRHGITLQDLIWANNLDYRARIYAGQNLRIPSPEDSLLLAAKFARPAASDEQKEAKDKFRQKAKPARKPQFIPPTEPSGKAGDEVNPFIVTANIRVKRFFVSNSVNFGVIQVDTGETLGHFADWLHVSAQYIRNLNRLAFKEEIHMDQNLIIPFSLIEKDRFEEKRYEFHKEFEEDFLTAYTIDGTWEYKIRRGDNIWTLCKRQFELPVWLIKKYNLSVNLNRLVPGQKIVIPIVEEKEETQS